MNATISIPAGSRPSKCSTCGARIFWGVTTTGKKIPTDPNGVAHFDTCKQAAEHRRPRARGPTSTAAAAPARAAALAEIDAAAAALDAAEDARTSRVLAWDFNGKGKPCPGCGNRHELARGCDGSELKGRNEA